jgi:putative ABC transport system ATP-binding protein
LPDYFWHVSWLCQLELTMEERFMISLKNIDKFYENRFQRAFVLKDVSLEIDQGEFVTIMGPSGAGKSTILNIIGLLDEPSAGEYFFMDDPVHKLRERKRAELHKHQIGFVFQAYHLIDELTVYENIETPLLYKGIKSKERKSMVAEMLGPFSDRRKERPVPRTNYLVGQQQLVGVARAIVGSPKLLLADEPTGNLHSEQGDEIMQLFKKLNDEGMTIIQVTHSEKNAQYGNRIIRLVDGIVRSDTKVAELEA